MATIDVIIPGNQLCKILKWKVSRGTMVSTGRILLLYQTAQDSTEFKGPEKKLRATKFGRVTKLLAKVNDIIRPGQSILELQGCKHSTVMKDLCAECGADLRDEVANSTGNSIIQASVPMVHSVPELKVCPELAEKIGKEDEERLLRDKKLVLLVDLDQTIVHTTNDNIPVEMKDVCHFQLYGPHSPWYHTRLRPHTRTFLAAMSELYELHICTFGARNYAHMVAKLLDNDGKLFSHRILSRDECFDPLSKTANLKALFPCGNDMVCIIDDREDVWQGCVNLVQVKPYHFFRHTGDIHAPPGIGKHDDPLPAKTFTEEAMENEKKEDSENGVNKKEANNPNKMDTNDKKKVTDHFGNDAQNNQDRIEELNEQGIEETKNVSKDKKKITESNGKESNSRTKENAEKSGKNEHTSRKRKDRKKIVEEAAESMRNDENEFEDTDDYLLYLEDILRRIHTEFYSVLEKESCRKSLKDIIPQVRARVLKGLHLTFSGLVPNHQKLNQSRAYKVARAFGAQVTQDLTDQTTHLVAIRPGTVKVLTAKKKHSNIKIVNPDWLWTCAERWEHVDERLYPLTLKVQLFHPQVLKIFKRSARASRLPPPHCSSPERIEEETPLPKDILVENFATSINPLMSFSSDEIANMDKEVDEDMSDDEADNPDIDAQESEYNNIYHLDSDESSNDYEEFTGVMKKRRRVEGNDGSSSSSLGGDCDRTNLCCDDDEDEDPATRFRRGEDLSDDLDMSDSSCDSVNNLEADDMEDEREWNAMGAALEKEFLTD